MNWFGGTIPEAVAEAKRNNKIFLVYIEGTDEMSKEMTSTFNDPAVAEKLSSPNVVALKLIANSVPYQQFCAIYPVLVIPSSFFIGGNGAPIEIITGSLSATEFSSKIDTLVQGCDKPKSIRSTPSGLFTLPPEAVQSSSQQADPGPSTSQNASALSQPSTAHDAEAAESTASLEEKLERAKALVEAQRQSKALEEQEEEKKREMDRRNMGKALQEAEKTKHDNELKEWAKSRAKEKEEERLAKERVKAMIAQDRAERAAKYSRTREAEEAERERIAQVQEAERIAREEAEVNSNEARIQFRLSNGSFKNKIFNADDTLADARRFVVQEVVPPYPHFSMCTTYPRRHFAESDFPETLRDLGLTPSAVILIVPANAVATPEGPGFFSSLFWMFLLPVTSVWNYISSFFRAPQPSVAPETVQNPRAPQPPPPSRSPNPPQREAPFARREGNIFRIHNQNDDDENNTWNGNSTQQM